MRDCGRDAQGPRSGSDRVALIMTRCPLCRAEIAPGAGTLLKAGRKPLGLVHKSCADVAQRGVALVGKLALMGAGHVLAARAPNVMLALKTAHQALSRRPGV